MSLSLRRKTSRGRFSSLPKIHELRLKLFGAMDDIPDDPTLLEQKLPSFRRDAPITVFVLALAFGIFVSDFAFDFFPQMLHSDSVLAQVTQVSVSFVMGMLLLFSLRRLAGRASRLSVNKILDQGLAALLFVFFLLGFCVNSVSRSNHLPIEDEEAKDVLVQVVNEPRYFSRNSMLRAKILSGEHVGREVQCWLGLDDQQDEFMDIAPERLRPGDVIAMRCSFDSFSKVRNPGAFDYSRFWQHQGIVGSTSASNGKWARISDSPHKMPLRVRALRFRSYLLDSYHTYFSGKDLAVLSALTLGDKTRLSKDLREEFSQAGISHILALSGMHLGILLALFSLLGKRFGNRALARCAWAAVSVLACWAFAFIAGLPLSLVRAAIMFSLAAVISATRRKSQAITRLVSAAFIMLLFDPQALFDVGFQLSYASVFSIVWILPRVPMPWQIKRFRILRWLYNLILVSIIAQLATWPIVAYTFHKVSAYAALSNLLVILPVACILCLFPFFLALPIARSFLAGVLSELANCVLKAVGIVNNIPYQVEECYPSMVLVVAIYVSMLLMLRAIDAPAFKWRWPFYASFACLLIGVSFELLEPYVRPVRPSITFYDSFRETPIGFVSSKENSYVWFPSSDSRHFWAEYWTRYEASGSKKLPSASDIQIEPDTEWFIAENRRYWASRNLMPPTVFADSISMPEIVSARGLTIFGHTTVATLGYVSQKESEAYTSVPQDIDYLLLTRSYRGSVEKALSIFSPQRLVLSPNLPQEMIEKITDEANNRGIPVWNISRQGALIVNLSGED